MRIVRVEKVKIKLLLIMFLLGTINYNTYSINLDSLQQVLKEDDIEYKERVQILVTISKKMFRKQPEKVEKYLSEAFKISKKENYVKGIYSTMHIQGMLISESGDQNRALKIYEEAVQMAINENDTLSVGKIYIAMGNIYDIQKNYEKALEKYIQGDSCVTLVGDNIVIGMANMGIGNIYYELKQINYAIERYQKSIKHLNLANSKYVSWSINNLASCFELKNELDSAIEYYNQSLKLKLKDADSIGASYSYHDLGSVYAKKGNFKKAIRLLKLSLDTKLSFKGISKETLGSSNLSLGKVYLQDDNFILSKYHLIEALSLARESGANELLLDVYNGLHEVYKKQNLSDSALYYLSNYVILNDSLNDAQNREKLTEMETKYETSLKEKEIIELEGNKKLQNVQIRNQRVYLLIFIIGLITVIVFAYYIFKKLQLTRKQKLVIEEQKEEVETQRDQIEDQKHEIEIKHEEIQESINYAKRIQEAILPPTSLLNKYIPNNFVYYKPKDVVAGDFYWMEVHDNIVFFAAADCTGHGVPGAMVSVVCHNALNRAVREFNLKVTGEILDKVRELVLITFEKSEEQVKDGMDICLCAWNKSSNTLQFSGANNPLYLVKNGVLETIKGTKQPIGHVDNVMPFETHTIDLKNIDSIYLTTDGYADQFGGPKGKKFSYKQLRNLFVEISTKPMEEQQQILDSMFDNWIAQGDEEQIDDVCVIGVRI